MSTKTSFKRIALVAVAALGFGMLSVVPSSAAVPQADSVTVTPTTTTPYYVGGTYTATVAVGFGALVAGDSITTTMSMTTNATGNIAFPVLSLQDTPVVTTSGQAVSGTPLTIMTTTESGTAIAANTVKAVSGAYKVTFSPKEIGTYLIQFKNSAGTNNGTATWTVTVVAKPALIVAALATPTVGTVVTKNYSHLAWPSWQAATGQVTAGSWNTWSESTRDVALEITSTGRGTDDLTFACSATTNTYSTTAPAGLGACMSVKVVQSNGMSTANTGMLIDSEATAMTVKVEGPATASVNGSHLGSGAKAFNSAVIPGVNYVEPAAQNTALGLEKYVYVYSNGINGVATVTISAGTLVLETFKVNFYGVPSKVEATIVNEVIPVTASADLVKTSATYQANWIGTGNGTAGAAPQTGAITAVVTDSAGVPVPGVTPTAASDTIANITGGTCAGLGVSGVTGATGTTSCNLVGAKEGLAKITLTAGTAVSAASEIRVGGNPTQAKISFGDANGAAKTDFVPGEQGTFNIQLLDAKGMSVPNGVYADFFSNSANTAAQDLLSTYAFAAQSVPSSTTQTAFLTGSNDPSTGLIAALAAKRDGSGGIQRWMVNMPVNASDVELSVGGFIKA
jgi:trimeric autotransporter adhesin